MSNGIAGSVAGWLPISGGTITGDFSVVGSGPGVVIETTTITQPANEAENASFVTTVILTAANSQDILGNVSRLWMKTQGFHQTSQHTSAYYGENTPFDTIVGGTMDWAPAFVGISGNQGLGTVTNAIDFKGHSDVNNGGGVLTNHFFFYQEPSTAATNEYGGYLSAPVGIGTTAPTYNLDINCNAGGNVLATNGLRVSYPGNGSFLVASTGASFFPGYNPGAGGLGVLDMVVGNNGAANLTTATGAFLYISSCAGTPTGVPAKAAVGRIAMEYDTTADKLWMYNGSAWKSVALT